jgi:glycosyltransferase involved in cell wall biosynthesis
MITVFSPSFADDANTNAQNLTVKEVVSRLPPEQFRVILLGDGAPDPRIGTRPNTEILRSSKHANTPRWLARLLTSQPDIYFFPRWGPLDSLFMHCRRYAQLPVSLVTYIVMALDQTEIGPVMLRTIREADRVVGNSRYVSQTITAQFGISAGTIYDGMSPAGFYPALPSASKGRNSQLTVLYAGSFQSRKRVDVVVREAAKWPSVNFRLAGKGEEEENIRTLVSKLNCGNVTFLGHLSQNDVADEMRKADIFLFPSIAEGHPQVLGQAAACGLPAIVMDKYKPDYVVDDKTGYLVKSDSELSQKLGLLLTSDDLRRRMSAAAAQHALQFDWDNVARDWANVFVDVVRERRKK